jgi:hypothetical protein
MSKKRQERAQGPQRPLDLNTVKAFWDTMSRHFGDIPIDLSLFNYKAEAERPLVRQAVKEKVPMTEAYERTLELLDDYHKGEDILWRPSKAYYSDKDLTSMLWVDDFKLDNDLKLMPLIVVQTSPEKYQAYFRLTSPVPVKKADEFQKTLARLTGDKSAGSFFQHRRMAGLANGKYDDDPICILYAPDEESPEGYIDPTVLIEKPSTPTMGGAGGVAEATRQQLSMAGQGQEGQQPSMTKDRLLIRDVITGQRKLFVKRWEDFLKVKDGKVDESATDMAWAIHIARKATQFNWDEVMIAFTIYDLLIAHSPDIHTRKRTGQHAREYLFRTIWRAIDLVKRTPRDKDIDML